MSTLILNPVFSYFSPFLRNASAKSRLAQTQPGSLPSPVSDIYLRAIFDIVVGSVLFLVSALPTLVLFSLSTLLSRNGLAGSTGFAVIQVAAQGCLGINLLLFLLYCGRTLLTTLRQL